MTFKMPSLGQHQNRTRGGFSLIELLFTIGILAILAVVTSMGVSSMTERARSLECIMNLRALGGGIQRYAIDHQGMLPVRLKPVNNPVAQQWHREMWPSFRHEKETIDWGDARTNASKTSYKKWQFHCPADREAASATPGLSYAVNVQLTDARVARLRAKQVLLLELKDRYMTTGSVAELESLPNRHRALNHVLFADYHLEALRDSEVPTLVNTPDAWKISD